MKPVKYLFILALFSMPKVIYAANSYSTGTVVFTLPSTSTADNTKSWATKNNDNWQTGGTALTALNAAVTNLQTAFSTGNLHISNTNYIYVSTVIQSGSSIHIVTGTIDSFNSSVGTFTKSVSVTRLIFNDGTNQITAASGGGIVGNSTFSKTITVGGEIVYSSATFPFFPGAWWVPEQSTCTITQVLATVQRPSGASAAFPFYAVAQSSWQWSTYGQLAVTTNTQTSIWKTENIVLTSTSTFGVGVTSAAVSNPASDLGLTFKYWCNQY